MDYIINISSVNNNIMIENLRLLNIAIKFIIIFLIDTDNYLNKNTVIVYNITNLNKRLH